METITARAVVIVWAICVGVVVTGQGLESDRQALVIFRERVGRRIRGWDGNSSVCQWKGILCDSQPRVISVSLPAAELSGIIPAGTLGNLTYLRKLRLRFNALRGSIPPDLSNCINLRTLYLQDNQFSGFLPPDFSVWPLLTRLNLASNNFSGPLPDSLNSLKRLGSLLLENNSFTGALPPLDLPKLVYFNVSYNNLTGPVPNSLTTFYPRAFVGTQMFCDLCTKKSKKYKWVLILGIVVGVVVLVCSIIGVLVHISRKNTIVGNGKSSTAKKPAKQEKQRAEEIDSSFTRDEYSISVQGPDMINNKLIFLPSSSRPFSLEDLLRASAELLGRGSVGTTYKALLETGNVVVVKRIRDTIIGPRRFAHIITALGNMQHQNLLPLKAYYYSKDEKLLLYDYMPLGSLASLLHGERGARRSPLDWSRRVHIALGAAMGIEYLHKQGSKMSHGNIKASNILVTENYDACVCDFGLAQILESSPVESDGSAVGERRIAGYRAPEVSERGKVSKEADVYSFGVLLLEVLTGKAPTQGEEGVDLPRWVQSVVREEWTVEVFDMDLMRIHHCPCPNEDEMLHLLQLGMACVAHYPDQRPNMSQVVKMIQDISSTDDVSKTEPQSPQLE